MLSGSCTAAGARTRSATAGERVMQSLFRPGVNCIQSWVRISPHENCRVDSMNKGSALPTPVSEG